MAVELATTPERYTAVKAKLAAQRITAPLFDTLSFTRNIEAAFEAMYARYKIGAAPDDIVVGSIDNN